MDRGFWESLCQDAGTRNQHGPLRRPINYHLKFKLRFFEHDSSSVASDSSQLFSETNFEMLTLSLTICFYWFIFVEWGWWLLRKSLPLGGTNSLYDLQCTMALSIEIEDFQVLKSKCLVFAQFWSKSNNSFFDWCKTVNILIEKYFLREYDQIVGIFWQNLKGWTDRPEIFHEDIRGQS